jgi:hypothetical protein
MKQLFSFYLLFCMGGILVMSGCRKGYLSISEANFQVKVLYPSYFNKTGADSAVVTLTNTVTLYTSSVKADTNGIATFPGLLPGNYQVTASRHLAATTASALTGYSEELFLNGSKSDFLIKDTGSSAVTVQLQGSKVGNLVLKEIFYTGSAPSYYSDQFYEIYNNSTDTLYADSLCIGDPGGAPGNSTSAKPYGFKSDVDNIYMKNVWMVPGNGKSYPIAPGNSIIISEDGINHKTDPLGNANSINLGVGISDFETYVPRSDNKDLDAPGVPNMTSIYLAAIGFDWIASVFGPSIAIFKHPNPASLSRFVEPGSIASTQYLQVPVAYVIDAVDLVANANAVSYKRFPASLDAGFKYCSGTYVQQSVRRKIKTSINGRKILQDTNNSTDDFDVVKPPTPKSW